MFTKHIYISLNIKISLLKYLDDSWKFKKKVDTLYTFLERANPNLIKKYIWQLNVKQSEKFFLLWCQILQRYASAFSSYNLLII